MPINAETYIAVDFKINPLEPAREICIAELAQFGFESFVENEEGMIAYVAKEDFEGLSLAEVLSQLHNPEVTLTYEVSEVAQQNWNAIWESSFDPIQVDDRCTVEHLP